MVKLTREQLYRWVWSCPVTKIAEELGISGSGLSKKCKMYNVPTPGRGYWRQVEQSKNVRRLPLPDPENGSKQLSIAVSEERAAGLGLPPVPFAGSLVTPVASDDSVGEIAALKMPERVEVSEASVTSGFASGVPSSHVRLTEQGEQTIADPAAIMALAALHSQSESARCFLEALREAGQECDAPTKAVLFSWTRAARIVLFQSDPIAHVIKECRGVASGEDNPGWWISVQQRDGGYR